MDITGFVLRRRHRALLYGDYASYRASLSKSLLAARRKLGIATKNRSRFHPLGPLTPDHVAANQDYPALLLLTCERAWAQAMSIKAAHSATGARALRGRARSHVISRLHKASQTAQELVDALALAPPAPSGPPSSRDLLEAKAYAALLRGAMYFEKQSWQPCLEHYATARIIYAALALAHRDDELFRDLLADTVDPSIRYAAYQLKTPRSVPVPTIAKMAFPRSDPDLVQAIDALNPSLLGLADAESDTTPRTLTWRSHQVQIEDAQLALSWASLAAAKSRLAHRLASSPSSAPPHKRAAAYDDILTAAQDAVDAAKQAVDELAAEGLDPSDARMQRLQMARTAVNFEVISWRIGRNRVLMGPGDGALDEPSLASSRRRRTQPADPSPTAKPARELPRNRKLAKLKEKIVLYDGTLQSIEAVRQLPGVAADQGLASNLDAFENYFDSLKCLAIGRSHALVANLTNALALVNRAVTLCAQAAQGLPPAPPAGPEPDPLGIQVTPEAVDSLHQLLDGELQRLRALVSLEKLRQEARDEAAARLDPPLCQRLHQYPAQGVDLANLVSFPPRIELMPAKPIFLDIAWNYIRYPTETPDRLAETMPEPTASQPKKGWFGFGRS